MKQRFDLLIFDWDGTLFDSIDWIVHCLQQAARVCGYPVPDAALTCSVIGLSIDGAMAELFPEADPELASRLIEVYRSVYAQEVINETRLFPGVREMLGRLKQGGFRLAVATGKSRQGIDQALAATGTAPLFDAVRCGEESASKPDPQMLYEIMHELKTSSNRSLMIGDSLHDLRMAKNAGIEAVGVACGANSREQLLSMTPLLCLQQTAELLPLLV